MKTNYAKITIIAFILAVAVSGAIWIFMKTSEDDWGGEKARYEVLVSVRDEMSPDPEEDRRSSMKKGYVIGVYDEGQKWSDTERISFLILKMELTQEQKEKLTRPIEKESEREKSAEEKEREGEEDMKEMETISIREYKIDLEKIGFEDPNSLLKGQPFEREVFGWEVVEKTE
ncbi:MAG: hypothetical protein WC260_04255 [Candidatus Pacearchaeota archaeon]|jgi:hypothetical protein|nr:hypothetical protein [Candidatus Moranbacteria bacterium]